MQEQLSPHSDTDTDTNTVPMYLWLCPVVVSCGGGGAACPIRYSILLLDLVVENSTGEISFMCV